MAHQHENKPEASSLSEKGIGLLERAWSWEWALRLVCAVMFLDVALLLRTGHGLTQWSPDDMALLKDVGWLALLIVAFTVTVALVIPVILTLIRHLIGLIPYRLTAFFSSSDDRHYQQTTGYVFAYQLRDLALRENSSFLLRIYENHEKKRKAAETSARQAGDLTATAILASLLDWGFAYNKMPDSAGLVQSIYIALGDHATTVAALVLMCAGFILKWAWFPPYRPNTIYYPPLNELLSAKKQDSQSTRRYGLLDRN